MKFWLAGIDILGGRGSWNEKSVPDILRHTITKYKVANHASRKLFVPSGIFIVVMIWLGKVVFKAEQNEKG